MGIKSFILIADLEGRVLAPRHLTGQREIAREYQQISTSQFFLEKSSFLLF